MVLQGLQLRKERSRTRGTPRKEQTLKAYLHSRKSRDLGKKSGRTELYSQGYIFAKGSSTLQSSWLSPTGDIGGLKAPCLRRGEQSKDMAHRKGPAKKGGRRNPTKNKKINEAKGKEVAGGKGVLPLSHRTHAGGTRKRSF